MFICDFICETIIYSILEKFSVFFCLATESFFLLGILLQTSRWYVIRHISTILYSNSPCPCISSMLFHSVCLFRNYIGFIYFINVARHIDLNQYVLVRSSFSELLNRVLHLNFNSLFGPLNGRTKLCRQLIICFFTSVSVWYQMRETSNSQTIVFFW